MVCSPAKYEERISTGSIYIGDVNVLSISNLSRAITNITESISAIMLESCSGRIKKVIYDTMAILIKKTTGSRISALYEEVMFLKIIIPIKRIL
ncbi:MAG: hypothetical protein WCQ47_03080 [bacterium]